jgi:hypothetical protein
MLLGALTVVAIASSIQSGRSDDDGSSSYSCSRTGWTVHALQPSSSLTTRAQFLSASAASFVSSVAVVMAVDPADDECHAMAMDNPRYLEQELEMKYGEDSSKNPRSRGMLVRRYTGDSTPYQFPIQEIRLVKEWPEQPPFTDKDFLRADSSEDSSFYTVPRYEPNKKLKERTVYLCMILSWVALLRPTTSLTLFFFRSDCCVAGTTVLFLPSNDNKNKQQLIFHINNYNNNNNDNDNDNTNHQIGLSY